MADWSLPRAMDGFEYRGVDAVFLENDHLRVLVLPGKGGDVLEFRDKRADVDSLWHADHNWQPPIDAAVPPVDPTAWHDHYPGGWQVNLPVAGFTDSFGDAPYGLHGESSLLPFEYDAREEGDAAVLDLAVELVRYPLRIERTLRLPAGESTLHVEETVENTAPRPVPYVWQHHLALAEPLVEPGARLDVPAASWVVDDYGPGHRNNRLAGGESFEWPHAPAAADGGETAPQAGDTVDLREFPPTDSTIHDVAYARDLEAGWYAVTNPARDVGFAFSFPTDPFESLWYWQPFGGHHDSPYYNRNYNAGLEPTTAFPAGNIPEAQEANGTMKEIGAGETLTAAFAATTYHGLEAVEDVTPSGTVSGR
ncbi:MAG: DUF4432 family protein [Halobacteriaceae archaeon]